VTDLLKKPLLTKETAKEYYDVMMLRDEGMNIDAARSFSDKCSEGLFIEELNMANIDFSEGAATVFFNSLKEKNVAVAHLSISNAKGMDMKDYDEMFDYLSSNKALSELTINGLSKEYTPVVMKKVSMFSQLHPEFAKFNVGVNHNLIDADVKPFYNLLTSPDNAFTKLQFISSNVTPKLKTDIKKAKEVKMNRINKLETVKCSARKNIAVIAARAKAIVR